MNKSGKFLDVKLLKKQIKLKRSGNEIEPEVFFDYIMGLLLKPNDIIYEKLVPMSRFFLEDAPGPYHTAFLSGFLTGYIISNKDIDIEIKEINQVDKKYL